ncbi:uncharacterized protein LOC131638082 [Vicia villosa]|uniref:uncharacterized protein LOC131638082 n=1 Tax=Vicia villosa TaxID=3911 RepID=UPI00273CAA75|nr:uncharacterized protein LOC131638082 [Vicia villosa]
MGRWEDNSWVWGLQDYILQHDHEVAEELQELCCILTDVTPIWNGEDRFVWSLGATGGYVVGEFYNKLLSEYRVVVEQLDVKEALKVLWQSWMPLKVKIFGWRLLKDRLATKEQLIRRGIIEPNDERLCVFGCGLLEDSKYLFLNCPIIRRVWRKILDWLGLHDITGADCIGHFMHMMEIMRSYCSLRRAVVFWMASCWSIWKQRNDIPFNNAVGDIEEIVHSIKMYSWWWLDLGTKHRVYCNFYEWNHSPLDFI